KSRREGASKFKKQQSSEPQEVHQHFWVIKEQGWAECTRGYKGYPCKALRVSIERELKIKAEWMEYLTSCRTSQSASDYQNMKMAYLMGDTEAMKEILASISQRCRSEQDESGDNVF